MYAVIDDRGKQYITKAGDRLRVDRMDVAEGDAVVFDRVLLVGAGTGKKKDAARVGQPVVDGVAVHANHLIHPDFAGTDQEITLSSERRQRRGEEMIAADPATEAETVLFDGWAPTYRTDDGGDDYAQTLATGVFRLHADRVDWTVHAGPDAPDVLGGRLGLAAAA